MSALSAALAAARALPWQAWAVMTLAAGIGLYGCDQRREGERAARQDIRQSNEGARDKADESGQKAQNCAGTWDRGRGRCLPDGSGR